MYCITSSYIPSDILWDQLSGISTWEHLRPENWYFYNFGKNTDLPTVTAQLQNSLTVEFGGFFCDDPQQYLQSKTTKKPFVRDISYMSPFSHLRWVDLMLFIVERETPQNALIEGLNLDSCCSVFHYLLKLFFYNWHFCALGRAWVFHSIMVHDFI